MAVVERALDKKDYKFDDPTKFASYEVRNGMKAVRVGPMDSLTTARMHGHLL